MQCHFCVFFSITAAWLNVSHGAFSAPHPMLISCEGLLWDSEREGHHQRDREQRHALTVSLWERHVHVILTAQFLIYAFYFWAISIERNTQKQTGNNQEKYQIASEYQLKLNLYAVLCVLASQTRRISPIELGSTNKSKLFVGCN